MYTRYYMHVPRVVYMYTLYSLSRVSVCACVCVRVRASVVHPLCATRCMRACVCMYVCVYESRCSGKKYEFSNCFRFRFSLCLSRSRIIIYLFVGELFSSRCASEKFVLIIGTLRFSVCPHVCVCVRVYVRSALFFLPERILNARRRLFTLEM